ncbi:hypothetical protein [Desulfovibrio legallii]|uniref:Uncharacterized protein n=1 Tax=Desulfovibrio legallii TaxID=571438 RepID=A0A1G7R330_9BACT|nr:hypothetical protein [Desulfovibrio legallii]SDG04360.1 hypothetical protein SAMN05192586_12611 [Desulfovibrio legallii]
MAFAALNPLAALWRQRGLTSLLMPPGFDAFAQPDAPAARPTPAAPQRPTAHRQPPSRPARPERSRPAAPEHAPQRATVHAFRPPAPDAPAATAEAAWRPLPPHVWPAPWRDLLSQTRPGHILWTYWNLGQDIRDPDAPGRTERRAFLQRLLRDLGHPAGTHTFWPVCLPPDPDALPPAPAGNPPGTSVAAAPAYVPAPDVFWSGARRLRSRGVVVLGSAAGKAAGLPGVLRPLQQLRHRGHLVWVLWDVENLLAQEQRYASMLAFLRQAFLQILR